MLAGELLHLDVSGVRTGHQLEFVIVSALLAPADSTGWVTVTEIDGVRFEMPRRPHHARSPVPGTDVTVDTYDATFDDIEVIGERRRHDRGQSPGGEQGRDLELTTPQGGGRVVLARVVLVDDLLVSVVTAFDPDDRDAATAVQHRMAASLDLGSEDAGEAAVPSELDGEYRVEWTVDELVAAGVSEDVVYQYALDGAHTWRFDDGRRHYTGEFPDGSRLSCSGTYEFRGEVIALQRQSPCVPWVFTARWELTDAGLVFSRPRLDGQRLPQLDVWMSQKPWARVG